MRGIHRSPVNSPHKGQWCGALMFAFICARINGWVNNHKADLGCHCAHYDVTVMKIHRKMTFHISPMWMRCGLPIVSSKLVYVPHINGLAQKRCNSIANALELRLSCTSPLISLFFMQYAISRYDGWGYNEICLYVPMAMIQWLHTSGVFACCGSIQSYPPALHDYRMEKNATRK